LIPEGGAPPPERVAAKIVYFLYVFCMGKCSVCINKKHIILHGINNINTFTTSLLTGLLVN